MRRDRSQVGDRGVLYPQGQPHNVATLRACSELLSLCGGEVDILCAASCASWEHFKLASSALVREAIVAPFVVLTNPNPITRLITLRKELETAAPRLLSAPWLLFFDGDAASHFFAEAQELGELSGGLESIPIWSTRAGDFLLITPRTANGGLLLRRLEQVEAAPPSSRNQKAIGTVYSERPPAPVAESEHRELGSQRERHSSGPARSRGGDGQELSDVAPEVARMYERVVGDDCHGTGSEDDVPESTVVAKPSPPGGSNRHRTMRGIGAAPMHTQPAAPEGSANPNALGRVRLVRRAHRAENKPNKE